MTRDDLLDKFEDYVDRAVLTNKHDMYTEEFIVDSMPELVEERKLPTLRQWNYLRKTFFNLGAEKNENILRLLKKEEEVFPSKRKKKQGLVISEMAAVRSKNVIMTLRMPNGAKQTFELTPLED